MGERGMCGRLGERGGLGVREERTGTHHTGSRALFEVLLAPSSAPEVTLVTLSIVFWRPYSVLGNTDRHVFAGRRHQGKHGTRSGYGGSGRWGGMSVVELVTAHAVVRDACCEATPGDAAGPTCWSVQIIGPFRTPTTRFPSNVLPTSTASSR